MGDTGASEPLVGQSSIDITSLPISILANNICTNLDDVQDLVAFSSSCSIFHRAATESKIWASLSERRWGQAALNLPPFRLGSDHNPETLSDSRVDYKSLFLHSNGWRQDKLLDRSYRPPDGFDIAMAFCEQGPNGTVSAAVVSDYHSIELLHLDSDGPHTTHRGILSLYSKACIISPICHESGLLACGTDDGDLVVFQTPRIDSSTEVEDPSIPDACKGVFQYSPGATQSYPITYLQYHAESSRLFGLWDRGECGAWRPNYPGCARVFNIDSEGNRGPIAEMREILDYYELCTVFPVGAGGNEVIGASVKVSQDGWLNGRCPHCLPELPASLCHHQHRSAAAAIITFDVRSNSRGLIVDRNAMPQRSFYPKLQIVREHYILASHAGAPLVALDRRRLSGPVAQVEEWPGVSLEWSSAAESGINSINSSTSSHGGATAPVNNIIRKRRSNALWLSASSTAVAGRADNGDIALWDLSTLLGWQDGTPAWREQNVLKPKAHCPMATSANAPSPPATLCGAGGLLPSPLKRAEVWLGDSWLAARSMRLDESEEEQTCLSWSIF